MFRPNTSRVVAKVIDGFTSYQRTSEELIGDSVRPRLFPLVSTQPYIEEAIAVGVHRALPNPALIRLKDLGKESLLIRNGRRSAGHTTQYTEYLLGRVA